MKCQICGETEEVVNDMCWWCEADANDPDPYVDDSLNISRDARTNSLWDIAVRAI